MVILGGWVFLMSEVPLCSGKSWGAEHSRTSPLHEAGSGRGEEERNCCDVQWFRGGLVEAHRLFYHSA